MTCDCKRQGLRAGEVLLLFSWVPCDCSISVPVDEPDFMKSVLKWMIEGTGDGVIVCRCFERRRWITEDVIDAYPHSDIEYQFANVLLFDHSKGKRRLFVYSFDRAPEAVRGGKFTAAWVAVGAPQEWIDVIDATTLPHGGLVHEWG